MAKKWDIRYVDPDTWEVLTWDLAKYWNKQYFDWISWWSNKVEPDTQKPIITNNSNPNNKPMTNKRKWAIAPDWSIQKWWTQEEFNQRLKDYEMEDQEIKERKARQEALRSQTVGNGDVTRDQIFKDALNKFAENPDGFTAEQRTMLYNAGKQLWYYNDTMLDNWTQTPAQTAPSVTPQNTANTSVAGTQVNNQQQNQAQSQSNNNVKQWGWSNFIWYV